MKFVQKNKKILIIALITILIGIYFIIEKIIGNYDTYDKIDLQNSSNIKDREEIGDSEKDAKLRNNSNSDEENNYVEGDNTQIVENENTEDNIEKGLNKSKKIYVYITGEVNNRGVVILNEGSRISDAIDAAGGITSNANISKINLVYILEDGMKVNIPNNNDLKENNNFQYITMNSGDDAEETSLFTSSSHNTGDSKLSSKSSNDLTGKRNIGTVNINSATQTELETLPGIGPSLALKIINHRNEKGKFSSIEDIKNVSGIGESKFNNIKDYITV